MGRGATLYRASAQHRTPPGARATPLGDVDSYTRAPRAWGGEEDVGVHDPQPIPPRQPDHPRDFSRQRVRPSPSHWAPPYVQRARRLPQTWASGK